jgi:hypothetical protein
MPLSLDSISAATDELVVAIPSKWAIRLRTKVGLVKAGHMLADFIRSS